MQRLHYTGDTLLVADEVAEVLLAYASALADARISDIVVIPVLDDSGETTRAELLLGPASQLYTTPVPGIPESAPDEALIRDLRERTTRLQPSRPSPESAAPWNGIRFDSE
jgi:hypothetical protein